ncbi:MAG: PP2C family protein-serine/threonine phosphatase [Longimicrobiales bacterium]
MSQESRSIRNAFLPREAPTVPGFELAGGTSTHQDGPGDTLWDHFTLSDGRSGFLVLKATPGALPTGFYLGLGRALFRGLAGEHDQIETLMAAVNRSMTLGTPEAPDQVLECAAIVPGADELEWCSAGTPPGGIIGRAGTFVELQSQGPPLGMMEGFQYRTGRHPLAMGDCCVTLSHGSSGLFKGAADLVAGLTGKSAGEVVSTVHKAIRQAQGEDSEVSVLFVRRS